MHSPSFLWKNEASSQSASLCAEATLPLFWTPTGKQLLLTPNTAHALILYLRNPFNDDLIASGSDDGKVRNPTSQHRRD